MANITYKLFADKMGGHPASSFIGQNGEIFYDPVSTTLRISDGATPGGIIIGSGGSGTVTNVGGTGTVSGLSLSGSVTSSGNLTLGGTLTLTSNQVTTALGYTPVSTGIQISLSTLITISTTTTYNLSTTTSYNILDVTAGGLTATINMPTTPVDGQVVNFSVIRNTVTLAQGTGTVSPGFAGGWVLGTTFTYIYHAGMSTWHQVA